MVMRRYEYKGHYAGSPKLVVRASSRGNAVVKVRNQLAKAKKQKDKTFVPESYINKYLKLAKRRSKK